MNYIEKQHILGLTSIQLLQHLGDKMKNIRINENITQKELADRTGVSEMTIVNMEHGKNISLETFLIILRALDKLDLIYKLCIEPLPDDPFLVLEMQKKRIKKKRLRVRK